jgi:exonuclease III
VEISTDLIPSFFLINIYNEYEPASNLYTVPRSLTPLSLPRRYIITGDLNTHHALCNCQVHTPRRAQELTTLIEQQNWRLVNIPDTPTYYYRNRKGTSILDLMLVMPHMAEEIRNWAIDDEQATGSDHEVIQFQVVSLHPDVEVTPHKPRVNW